MRCILTVALFALSSSVYAQGWLDVTPATPGPDTAGRSMCYDPARAVTWLLGIQGNLLEAHAWDGSSWVPQTAAQPSTGDLLATTWDQTSQTVVILCSDGVVMSWDGTTVATLPSIPSWPTNTYYYAQLEFDYTRSEIVCLHNSYTSSTSVSGMAVWDGAAWSTPTPAAYPPYYGGITWFDPGSGHASSLQSPTHWEWTGANWHQRWPTVSPTLGSGAYISTITAAVSRGFALALDMYAPGPTPPRAWKLSDANYEEVFFATWPASRFGELVAYDSVRDRFVLHGGSNFRDTWELEIPPITPAFTTYGSGCTGAGGVPRITTQLGQQPTANTTFSIQVSNLPWAGPAFMWLGLSNLSYGTVPLPLNLSVIGAPACDLLVSPDVLIPIPNIVGTSVWQLAIPNAPGFKFYNQAIAFDPTANSLGLVFSNGSEAIVGF